MANRYWVGGTANWDNTAGTKWSTTDGGAGGSAVPTSADDVFFTAASGAVTCTISVSTCKSINFTGFTGTLAGSAQLSVAGSVTFVAGMTLTYSGQLNITATATLTSAGKTLIGTLNITSGVTVTLADDWLVSGSLASSGTPTLIGGKTLTIGTSVSPNAVNFNNCNLIMNGTGTLNGILSSSTACLITINTAGTITFSSTLTLSGATSMTYTAGTITVGTNTLTLSSSTGTFNINSITLYNLTISGVSTVTLGQNINVSNLTTLGTLGQACTINGNTLNTAGLTKSGTAAIVSGTTNIVLNGTGNWTDTTSIVGGYLSLNVTINTAGTVTLVGTAHRYRTGTITYTSGTVNPGTSKFTFDAATTLNTNGMSFYNIDISGTTTITNNSLLTVSNSLSYLLASVVTFAGTTGWTAKNFFILTSNNINHTLVANKTYTVTTYFESIATTSALKDSLISSIPGTKSIFTLNYGATQNVGYTNATDIDSSRGQTIWTFNGVVTTTFNWNAFTSSTGNQKTMII